MMHDSGKRQEFETGAVRDTAEKKPRPDLISPYADEREGVWMERGAAKYAERNWEKGIPISRCVASLRRHFMAYMMGKTDEDHMAAVRTNASFILHYEHEIAAGRLPISLDDMPKYEQRGVHADGVQPKTKPHHPYDEQKERERRDRRKAMYAEADEALSDWSAASRQRRLDLMRAIAQRHQHQYEQEDLKAQGDCMDVSSEEPKGDKSSDSIPTVYIAGPMRGKPRLNWDTFFEAEAKLQAAGYNTINPARLDEERGIDPDAFDITSDLTPGLLKQIVRSDLDYLIGLDPAKGDGVALLDDACLSVGVNAETAVADWLRLQVHLVDVWVAKAKERSNA